MLKSSFVAEPRPASLSFPDEVNELVKSRQVSVDCENFVKVNMETYLLELLNINSSTMRLLDLWFQHANLVSSLIPV